MKWILYTLSSLFAAAAMAQMPPPLVRNPYTTNTVPAGWQALQYYTEAGPYISLTQSGSKWRIGVTLQDPITNTYNAPIVFLGSSNYMSGHLRVDGDIRLTTGKLQGTSVVPLAAIEATGTRNNTTYLRGDGTWATLAPLGTTEYVATADPTKIVITTNGTLYTINVGPQVAITTNAIEWTGPHTYSNTVTITTTSIQGHDGTKVTWQIQPSGIIVANGQSITNLNADELRSGTVPMARLSWDVARTNQAQTFYGNQTFQNNVTVNGTISGNGSGLTSLNASQLTSGTVPMGRLSSEVARTNIAQRFYGNQTVRGDLIVETGQYIGNGAGLTNLNASELASGTVPMIRLSTEVARTNIAQTFYGNQTFQNNVTIIGSLSGSSATFSGTVTANSFSGSGSGLTGIPLSALSTTGTPSATTVLHGDGQWRPVRVYNGTGSPEGVLDAPAPAIYYSSAGGVWLKTTTSGNTGWVALVAEN